MARSHRAFLAASLLSLVAALGSGCFTIKGEPTARDVIMPEAMRAGEMMVGSFSSAAQAKADPEFRDVRLHMVRIWPDRRDAFWMYVEQAMAESAATPYRQRIYAIKVAPDGSVASHVHEIPGDPLVFAGAWREPARLDALNPDLLSAREGCTVWLKPEGDGFSGMTRANECVSTLRGAAYATSEVTVTRAELRSWDRGFDKDGTQVWGSTKGPYLFRRE